MNTNHQSTTVLKSAALQKRFKVRRIFSDFFNDFNVYVFVLKFFQKFNSLSQIQQVRFQQSQNLFSIMEPKFKQLINMEGTFSIPLRISEPVVQNAINSLIENIGNHVYEKTAIQKSKTFLKNKIVGLEVDSVKQIYQTRPTIPSIIREQPSPRTIKPQCLRPMSAQIRRQSPTNITRLTTVDSKKSIQSSKSRCQSYFRNKRNLTSTSSLIDNKKKKKYQQNSTTEKRFFAVNSHEDSELSHFIEELRMKKSQQQKQKIKKEDFLKSIQLDSTSFSAAQAKFIQSVNRKKFIYGHQGQVIEINPNSTVNHLKKISTISKSRIQIKTKTQAQLKKFQQELKQNIFIQFKGRQTPKNGEFVKVNINEALNKTNNKSAKQTKRPIQDNKISIEQINLKKVENIQLKRGTEAKIISGKQSVDRKKQIQKILFYNSPNSLYRVINDCPANQKPQDQNNLQK